MHYDEFLARVQAQANLSSPAEAEHAVLATLETLGECLTGSERLDLSAHLTKGIGKYLQPPFVPNEEAPVASGGRPLSREEFLQRVQLREGVPLSTAEHHVRAVLEVLSMILTHGELDAIRAQLPIEIDTLFEVR